MKHRLARVNEVIKRELSDIISREITFGAQTLVTVHAVDIVTFSSVSSEILRKKIGLWANLQNIASCSKGNLRSASSSSIRRT
jgi:hypothetical protein